MAEPQTAQAAPDAVAVLRPRPWQRLVARLRPAHPLWWGPPGLWAADGDGASHHWADFEAWCAAHAGQACRLYLSAWWVHELLADAGLPLSNDAAVLAYARPLLQHYHGAAAAGWPLAAWAAAGRRGASALHGLPLAQLRASAARHGVALRGLHPWWPQALAASGLLPAARRRGQVQAGRLLLAEGRLVTVVDLQRGAIVGLQQRRLAEPSLAALAQAQAQWPAPDSATGAPSPADDAPAAGAVAPAPAAVITSPGGVDPGIALRAIVAPALGPVWVAGHGLAASSDDGAAARAAGLRLAVPLAALAGRAPAPGWWRPGGPLGRHAASGMADGTAGRVDIAARMVGSAGGPAVDVPDAQGGSRPDAGPGRSAQVPR